LKEDALYVRSIARSFRVLEAFSFDRTKMTLTELTKLTGMSKSTVQRLVYTLEKEGYLIKDEKEKVYKLSMRFFQLGSIALKDTQVSEVAKLYLERLRDQSKESVFLNIIFEGERMCIASFPSHHEIQLLVFVGQRSPLYAGASAKVLLAFLGDDKIEDILNKNNLKRITDQTLYKREDILKEMNQIRKQGYAISNQERVVGAFSISFPIFNVAGEVVASISMTIPTIRLEKEEISNYVEMVRETANLISMEMGYKTQ
jgi:IclR family transcriptional regulator, KDG regulon repressor